MQTREENKANRLKQPMARRVFREGEDARGLPYERMRWSRFRNLAPAEMFTVVSDHVFPFIREMGGADTAHGAHMKGARFTIPTPGLLAKVVDLLAEIPMEDAVVPVGSRQNEGEWQASPIHHNVALGAGLSTIGRVRPCRVTPFLAGTDEASSEARDQSIRPARFRRSSMWR